MDFYTRKEVAEYLRVHERTVDRWIQSGALKGYKLGTGKTALWRIRKTEVERFLKKHLSKN
jgi:excisionase family DNA binding protein